MRSIALDVHRDFCEVAIKDAAGLRLAGRVKTEPEELELFAQSLAPDDQVALEASEPALAIARILELHVGRVVVANTHKVRAIAESKVKTDKLDACTLCELLAAGFLPAVWSPDEFTRALRRWLQRRTKLVRARTRAKNDCHAVLARNLKGKPPMSDICGRKGRQWLAALELPADESETVACRSCRIPQRCQSRHPGASSTPAVRLVSASLSKTANFGPQLGSAGWSSGSATRRWSGWT